MAYREFRNAKTYDAPEIDILPNTIATLQQAVRQQTRQQLNNRNLAATYKANQLADEYTTDTKKLSYLTQDITLNAINDLNQYGYVSPATREKEARAQSYKAQGHAQYQMARSLEKANKEFVIQGPKNGANYHDPSFFQQTLIEKELGRDDEPEIDYNNREQRLREIAPTIGKNYIVSFKKAAFLNDLIDEEKTQIRANENKSQSGVKSSSKITAVFFDKNGKPGLTDEKAISIMDSYPALQENYKQEVDLSLLDDAKKMMATKEGEWLKGMPPDQIIKTFREDPSLNTESKLKPGQRELELLKKDLLAKQRVSLDNSYDAGDYTDESGLGITNKKVGHSYTFHAGNFSGPGGVIPLKTGKNFTIPSTSKDRVDLNTGRVSHSLKGKRDFNVEGYQLVPVQGGNSPVKIDASSPEDYIQKIKQIPLSSFDPSNPNAITGMQVGLKGTTFDKARIIQQTFDAEKPLNKQYADAVKTGNEEEVNRINAQKDAINKIRQYAGQDELDEDDTAEFQSLLPFLGIEGIEYNELVLANPQDVANVKAVTGGFDISNSKNWDEGMLQVKQAFDQRKAEAQRLNYGKEATREMTAPKKDTASPPRKEDIIVPAIPQGRIVVIKDGKRFHIPLEQKEEAIKAGYTLEEK